jgi:hypothetical protein
MPRCRDASIASAETASGQRSSGALRPADLLIVAVTCHLRGFNRATEFDAVDCNVPSSMLPAVRQLIPEAKDDPDLVEPH